MSYEAIDRRQHEFDHLHRHPRINADPERTVHDHVRCFQGAAHAIVRRLSAQLVEAWMPQEISGKEHARLYSFPFEMADDLIPREFCSIS